MSSSVVYNHFNRGELDEGVLARDDVEKLREAGSYINNFMPMRYGPMAYRPGLEYLGDLLGESYLVPFVAATDDTALMEFSNNLLRIWVDDTLIARTSVTSTVANGTFDSDIASWTDDSGVGSATAWETGGYAALTGASNTDAVLYQTISDTQHSTEHTIRLEVVRAPIKLQLGTTGSGSNDIYEGALDPGTHSLVFTSHASLDTTITLVNVNPYKALVDSVAWETTGTLTLPTTVSTAYLSTLRQRQSSDVVFFARDGAAQFKVERRGVKSWSIVDYRSDDGPFGLINNTKITMTPAALTGDTTLTASASLFRVEHVGSLFKLRSYGQQVEEDLTTDTVSDSIRVTGVDASRYFAHSITGTWSGTLELQRSPDDATWTDYKTYTANQSTSIRDDGLDNSTLYYRWKFLSGGSGTAAVTLDYAGGSSLGIGRVTGFTSDTVVNVQVLENFGNTDATRDWYEGEWSDAAGYPTAVNLYEGRLWWAGKNKLWGSVSDAYYSYDDTVEGASAPIRRTIGFGPVDNVEWLADSTRLIMGIASDEIAVRSSSLGEVLTQDNVNLKGGSNQGTASVEPIKMDASVVFVQRYGKKVYEISYDYTQDSHAAMDQTALNPQILSASIIRMAIMRQPETRIVHVLDDGSVRVHTRDIAEEVNAWSRVSTDGDFEDIVALPGSAQDEVYFAVNRDGGRYLEKCATVANCQGGDASHTFDSFKTYTSPGTTITGLSHLEGKTVGVWADGQDRGDFTVSSGQITVGSAWTNVVVGLRYVADWTSNKIAGYAPFSVLGHHKRVVSTALIMQGYWQGSVQVGPSAALLSNMPLIEEGTDVDQTVTASYHEYPFEFDGESEIDPRIYIQATGPCVIQALIFDTEDDEVVLRGKDDDK